MTEKKTFKHPLGLTSAFGNFYAGGEEGGEYEIYSEAEGLHRFPLDEWDIEVTFTKKVKPEVGGMANMAIGGPYYTVIAVSGDRVWLQDTNDEYVNFVRRFDQLVDVKPWQPA